MSQLSDALAEKLMQDAGPGIFSGGKQVVYTQTYDHPEGKVLLMIFNDGGALRIQGDFYVDYAQPGSLALPQEAIDAIKAIEGVNPLTGQQED